MKTSTLRHAISLALFITASGTGGWATAQDRTRDASGQDGASTSGKAHDASPKKRADEAAADEVTNLQTMVVTGTRIRGGSTPSPTITIGSEQIRQEGFADLGEVIRSVPQNFSGGQNPGVIGAASGIDNQNLTGGSALNLRGLGADASLTLLNGRRMAYDGFSQAVDISAIPAEAIERLEIVPDGASAIYGSDAVGGVANVVLKPDYEGLSLGLRYGGATDGGLATREYTATAGATWSDGGGIVTLRDAHADPIHADQRRYTSYLFEPYTIYAGSTVRSGLLSVHQSLGNLVEFKLDALGSRRDTTSYAAVQAGSYFPSSSKGLITLLSPSVDVHFSSDWTMTVGGVIGKDDATYASGTATAAGSSITSRVCYCNRSRSAEISAEGPLFSVGGGDARLAVGAGVRRNAFHALSRLSGSSYGGSERARFAYAELALPFVSPASDIRGVHRLEVNAAMRGEDDDGFGRVATPKLGLIYAPDADFTFKASWGKSFKAPTLLQRYESRVAYLWAASMLGATDVSPDATALMSYGGNPDLRPERARTWTASLALHPESLPGLEAELTWFGIDYRGRVIQPVNYQLALSDPAYANFVDRLPTTAQIRDLLAAYDGAFYNQSGLPYDADKVVALVRDQYVNATRQQIKGIDLSGSYRIDLGDHQVTVRGSASWLDSKQRTLAGQPVQQLAGTVFNPAHLNGRLGAIWVHGGFTASGFVNHVGGLTNGFAPGHEKTSSFTTMDATLNYETGADAGVFSSLTLGLSVQNVFNRAPPLFTAAAASYVPYDATNYSAIGRYVSASIARHW